MALTQVLILCLGLAMLAKQGVAQPGLTTTSLTVAENIAAGVIGNLVHSGTPTSVSVASLPMDGMLTAAINAANIDYTLVSGFHLDYDVGTSFTFTTILVDGSAATATVTVTLTITDVTDEYTDAVMYTCVSGTSTISAGTVLATPTITSGVVSAYTISAQSPNLALASIATAATGAITVASGKTIDPKYFRSLTLTLQSISTSATPVTSTASLEIYFGTCSSTSGAAPALIGSITLLLAALVAMLQ